jgi:ABC-type polysaccharide/polyol phosphate export permease
MEAILEPLLKVGGVPGLVIGVYYLLYRQVLSMGIFAKLGSAQTFVIIMVVGFLVWSMAMSALFMGKAGLFAFVGGSSNTIQQNVQSKSNE